MSVEKLSIQVLFVSAVLLVLAAPTAAQSSRTVEIDLPSNLSKAPAADIPALTVSAGESVEFRLKGNGNVFAIFTNPGKTPFVNARGEPVYSFPVIQMGKRFKIRTDANPCTETAPGKSDCKYMIVDLRNPQRPPLDPYIIIRR